MFLWKRWNENCKDKKVRLLKSCAFQLVKFISGKIGNDMTTYIIEFIGNGIIEVHAAQILTQAFPERKFCQIIITSINVYEYVVSFRIRARDNDKLEIFNLLISYGNMEHGSFQIQCGFPSVDLIGLTEVVKRSIFSVADNFIQCKLQKEVSNIYVKSIDSKKGTLFQVCNQNDLGYYMNKPIFKK